MSGLVQRLRNLYWCTDLNKRARDAEIAAEAADEINRLRSILFNYDICVPHGQMNCCECPTMD